MSAPTHHLSNGLWCLIAAVALITASTASSQAQELCVTCEEPFAVYRCAFDDHSPIRVTAPGAPLVCAKQLAHRGHHARCSIRRNSSGPCEGELAVVTPSADTPLVPPPGVAADGNSGVPNDAALADPRAVPGNVPGAAQVAAPGAGPGEPVAPVAAPDGTAQGEPPEPEEPAGPPKTVEELAKRTAKSSKEGLEDAGDAVVGAAKKTGETIGDAGDAVGNAAKSTWRCLSTLFSDC